MKNAAVIKALPNVKLLRIELKSLDAQIEAHDRQRINLTNQQRQLDREVRLLGEVTEIFEGVALISSKFDTCYGYDFRVGAAGEDFGRSALVYTNAHTSKNGVAKDWCVELKPANVREYGSRTNHLGNGWGFRDGCLVARRWVALDEVPREDYQKMVRLRHKLDPNGTAPKRRRDAFEAAYMAGQIDVAEKILRERVRLKLKESAHA